MFNPKLTSQQYYFEKINAVTNSILLYFYIIHLYYPLDPKSFQHNVLFKEFNTYLIDDF